MLSENCTGKECPEFERCYVTKLRQRAADSDIITQSDPLGLSILSFFISGLLMI